MEIVSVLVLIIVVVIVAYETNGFDFSAPKRGSNANHEEGQAKRDRIAAYNAEELRKQMEQHDS